MPGADSDTNHRLLCGLDYESGFHRFREVPSGNLATEQIQRYGQIHPSLGRSYVGDVADENFTGAHGRRRFGEMIGSGESIRVLNCRLRSESRFMTGFHSCF